MAIVYRLKINIESTGFADTEIACAALNRAADKASSSSAQWGGGAGRKEGIIRKMRNFCLKINICF